MQLYCDYITVTPKNYTVTNLSAHKDGVSHDKMTRFLKDADLKPEIIWRKARQTIEQSKEGYIVFDDTVLDKRHAKKIESARNQYSGNAGGVINGIGVVTCIYIDPKSNNFWAIDCRVFNPDEDGKSKIDHVQDMLNSAIHEKKLLFSYVLMDTWYATSQLMQFIEEQDKTYYCPIKKNRKVKLAGQKTSQDASSIEWDKTTLSTGIFATLKGLKHSTQLFYIEASTSHPMVIATNSSNRQSAEHVCNICAQRWKIEQLHRELKQTVGIEKCQCRLANSQKTHIIACILAWLNIKYAAKSQNITIYQFKEKIYSDFLRHQLENPAAPFTLD